MFLNIYDIIKKYDVSIKGIYHIGAHYGQEYSLYKDLNIKNLVFFEPCKNSFEILKNNINDENVILINKALGNKTDKVLMFTETVNEGQSSSVLKPKIHLTQYPWISFNSNEYVDMVKLDDLNFNLDINFINIDVQGYELEVFKGAEKTLENIDYIYTEINVDEVYEDCVKLVELDNYLNKFNFKRVETTLEFVSWGEAFYIKIK